MQPRTYDRYVKRPGDAVVAVAALLILSPLLLILALMVRIRLGSPVLFRQPRLGRDGKVFMVLKFRSMTDMRGPDGILLPASQRLTGLGNWLRHTSLDELPELFNILRGEMSLVGPRPLLSEYAPLYSPHQARRHEVRPGLTGLAQVSGRNRLNWPQRFELDVFYVDHESLSLDCRILWMTVAQVLKRDGITPHDSDEAPPFTGNAK